MEKRSFEVRGLRVEKRGQRGIGRAVIRGYAIRFNELSSLMWGFREEIAPGAFADSVENGDVRALWQHDTKAVLGRTSAGTLSIWDDNQGLAFKIQLPDTQAGRDALASIERGDVNGMSFGFSVSPNGEKWREDVNGAPIRTVTDGVLYEISPVTFPAYPTSSVRTRSRRIGGGLGHRRSGRYAGRRAMHRERELQLLELECSF